MTAEGQKEAAPQTPTPASQPSSKLEVMVCLRCEAGYEGEVLRVGGAKIKRSAVCPRCEDVLKRAEEEREAAEVHEAAQKKAYRLAHRRDHIEDYLQKRGVPLRYRGCSRENYVGQYPSSIPAFIHGPIGCGKTHLAVALMRDQILNCQALELPRLKFVRMVDLLKEIRASFREDTKQSEQELLDYYGQQLDHLVLDDLGVEKITEWVMQTLYDLVDKRYVEMKPTTITSNIALKEFEKLYGDMGKRLASRIVGMGAVVELEGADRRIVKQNA